MTQTQPDPGQEAETADSVPPRRRRFRMTRRRWIVVAVVVLLAAGGGGVWWFLRPQPEATAGTRTFTAQAEKSDQTVTVGLSGTLSPKTEADLSFSVSGTVTDVYVSAGDTVTKGQKLARIDDSDLEDALALAKANLKTAQANLDDTESNSSSSSASITAAEAQVKSAKAAVTSAEEDLDDAVLRSTIKGTIASIDLSVGDTVGSSSGSSGSGSSSSQMGGTTTSTTTSSSSVVVISTNKWKLDGTVGSTDLGSVKAGQSVAITPDGATDALEGTVTSVGIVATSTSDGSATFPVEISISGDHPDLYSGTTADAVITVNEYSDVLTVPTAAITTQDGKSVVNLVDGDSTTVTEVGVGTVFGDATEITSGLSEGDTVQVSFTMPTQSDSSSSSESDSGLFGGFGGGGGMSGGTGSGMGGPPSGGGGMPGGGNR